jgi:hypothetical protein
MNRQQPTVLDPFAAQQAARNGAYGPPAGFGPAGFGPAAPPAWGPPAPPAPPRKKRTGLVAGGIAGSVVALGGLVVGAIALFGPSTLVSDDVEREIVRITQEQVGVPAQGVACPEDIPVSAGATTTCTATVDGQPVTFTVRQDDDQGNLTIEHTRLLAAVEVEDALSAQLTAEVGEDIVAVCSAEGQTVLVNEPGTAIPCTAVNVADTSLTAEVLVSVDAAGTVTYEFA